jgi:hypothetical protein
MASVRLLHAPMICPRVILVAQACAAKYVVWAHAG